MQVKRFIPFFLFSMSILFLVSCYVDGQDTSDGVLTPPDVYSPMTQPSPTPTPSPSPTPTLIPTPTPSPTPSPTPLPQFIEPMTEEPVWYDGFVDPRTVRAEVIINASDIDVLVNKYYSLPDNYVPELVLAEHSASQYIHPVAADAWNIMQSACLEEIGEQLFLVQGYRSYSDQSLLFSFSIESLGLTQTIRSIAYAGRSDYQLGLAIELTTVLHLDTNSAFSDSQASQWLNENAHLFGFILRYPLDKEEYTNYEFNAAYYRFVGIELATALFQNNQSLEEYYLIEAP